MPAQAIITLTSDFGLADTYVAAMKGVILSLNPNAVIVDVSHAVRPQRIEQGAFLLEVARPYFPANAIHVAVVDPGVGTERRGLALRTSLGVFVGPDNGVLSPALAEEVREGVGEGGGRVPLPEGSTGVELTNARYQRLPVSHTFHGRDVFAPAAAHLSLGVALPELGEAVTEAFVLPPFRARRQPDGSLAGRVVHVDGFGNLITDVRAEDLSSSEITVEIRGRQIAALRRAYAGAPGLAALVGSSGFLEIALPGGSAAAETGGDIGEPVTVRG
ncbi:MAG: SAM-dependent chlorinase/fluorinase [Dehalococcoidia bacterium]|nr:SAM-dependent chlorinase/fluorinase [Dehalococcoidia bacterium]